MILPSDVQKRVQNSVTYLVLFTAFLAVVVGVYRGGVHLAQLEAENVTIGELPAALALSFLRVVAAYVVSLAFAILIGLAAALSRTGERVLLPAIDILQSVPVIGFFPAAIAFFIGAAQGHRMGVELAAVFLIFTSQAWNMAFAVYEAIKTIPQDCSDAVLSFDVRGGLRFRRLYMPASIPRLVTNSILSWSNGWYFLVACEIIAIGNMKYHLPGIGSFLARAAEADQIRLVLWGLGALTLFILGFDTVVWRPLSLWAERFRYDFAASNEGGGRQGARGGGPSPWARLRPLRLAAVRMIRICSLPFWWFIREVALPLLWDLPSALGRALVRALHRKFAVPTVARWHALVRRARWVQNVLFWAAGAALGAGAGRIVFEWFKPPWPAIVREIPVAVLYSTLRLTAALALSLLWTIPVVLYSWNRPRLRRTLTTLAQIGASLPAVALFPLLILVVVRKLGGGMEMASILLLVTGMQWYVLFNCLGGASNIPADLAEAVGAMGLSRFHTWRRLVLPAIRPALITGMITAWGGGWNALVFSEYMSYREEVLTVHGIGALLNRAVYQLGDQKAIFLCLAGMVAWILVLNALVWRPLYQDAAERYKLDQ